MRAMRITVQTMQRLGLGLVLAVFAGATFAEAADVQNGGALARRWCASCHVVASDQRQPTGEAPPFAALAKRKDFDASRVAYFLLAPHLRMPDMGLSRNAAEDLAAYIASLAK